MTENASAGVPDHTSQSELTVASMSLEQLMDAVGTRVRQEMNAQSATTSQSPAASQSPSASQSPATVSEWKTLTYIARVTPVGCVTFYVH